MIIRRVCLQVSLTPAVQCSAGFQSGDERRLPEQKSPVFTAQTTRQPLKNWPRRELWRFYPTQIQMRLREARSLYAVTPLWEPKNIGTRRRKKEEKI